MDEATDINLSHFFKFKIKLKEKVTEIIKDLKSKDSKFVTYIQCAKTGERNTLQTACVLEGLGFTFVYTAPEILQSNGNVEPSFATLNGQVQVMMNQAPFPHKARNYPWV